MVALRAIPNVTIASPYDEHELRRLMYTAQLEGMGTFVIRYPRGSGYLTNWRCPLEKVEVGRGRKLHDGKDIAIISIGPIGHQAARAIDEIEKIHPNVTIAHYDLRYLKPLDENILREIGEHYDKVVTLEDGALLGGMGSAVLEWLSDHQYHPQLVRLGLPDKFVPHATVKEEYEMVGIDSKSVKQTIEKILAQQ